MKLLLSLQGLLGFFLCGTVLGSGNNTTPSADQPCMASDGWASYYNSPSMYLLVDEDKRHAEAEQNCLSKGGHLAMANDEAEFNILMRLADDELDKDVWIGIRKVEVVTEGSDGGGEQESSDRRRRKREGTTFEFRYCDDNTEPYLSWKDGDPGDRNCVRIKKGDGYEDRDCTSNERSICECVGKWFDVATGVYIKRVDWLSEENANLSMTVEYNLAWVDDRLTGAVPSGWMPLPATLLWSPALMFGNKVRRTEGITKPRVHPSTGAVEELDVSLKMWLHSSGFIFFQMTKVLKVRCNVDLHSYPFDDQECPVQLHAYNGVRFTLVSSAQSKIAPISSDASNVVSQFRLMGATVESTYSTFFANDSNDVICPYFREACTYDVEHCMLSAFLNCSTCGDCGHHVGNCSHHTDICGDPGPTVNSFTTLKIKLSLSRRIWLYVFRTFVPTLMVVVLSWMSPWMGFQTAAVIGRVSLGASALLTIVMGADLKHPMEFISYTRAIDVWMAGCLMAVFCGLLETAVAYYIHYTSLAKESWKRQLVQPKVSIPRARFCRPYYLLQYLPPPPQRTVRFRLPGTQTAPSQLSSPRPARLARKIDRATRTLIPGLFLVFCVVFWVHYFL
ncbi:glycine receptor subunit alphaZ1-like isoform X4 [Branchiostoma floridae x Branchiostoma japonicum]